jgi:hypothetical protein
MKRSDFQIIAFIGIILGVLLLTVGIFTATYYIEIAPNPFLFMNPTALYPYAAYSGILLGEGAVSLVVGITCAWRVRQEERRVKPPPIAF